MGFTLRKLGLRKSLKWPCVIAVYSACEIVFGRHWASLVWISLVTLTV